MGNKPIRVQRQRKKGWRMPENTIYVGRPSKFCNPFIVGKDGDLEEVLQKYHDFLMPYKNHQTGTVEQYMISKLNIDEIKKELKGKNLACWCSLESKCHADILLRIANEN